MTRSEEAARRLTDGFPGSGLLESNRRVLDLLLEGTSAGENRRTGERSPTVRFVDFEQRENNRFIAVCQYKVRIPGTEHHIIPDVVLFLNGLPVVVIECKSPKVKDAIPQAIDQLLRYSGQRGATGEGSARLFHYNQFVVVTCRQEARFGTLTTHTGKHFYRWTDPWPRTVDDPGTAPAARTISSGSPPGCSTPAICSTSSAPSPCSRSTTRARPSRSSGATSSSGR